jgi:hypothetical protein
MSIRAVIREIDTSDVVNANGPVSTSYRTVDLGQSAEVQALEFLLREPEMKRWRYCRRELVGVELPEPRP